MTRADGKPGSSPDLDALLSLGGGARASASSDPGGEGAQAGGGVGELREVDVDAVFPNEFQPRQHFDEESLAALTESVRELGVLQPILVRPDGSDCFELIAGERRWRAARLAGLPSIPAIVRHTADQGSLEQAIVENLHREDLNALEEAAAYQQLVDDFGLTQDEVAVRVGKSRSAVSNTLRLFQLPGAVQRLVSTGELGAGHARAILSLDDPSAQLALAQRAVAEDLSVRSVEEAVRAASRGEQDGGAGVGRTSSGSKSAAALEVERRLEERLATRVEVVEASGTGRIMIRFADREDLDRIFRLLED